MNERSFPPGVGTIAWVGALALALVIAIWAAAPHFATQIVSGTSGGTSGGTSVGPTVDPTGGPTGGATGGPTGGPTGGSKGSYVGGANGSAAIGGANGSKSTTSNTTPGNGTSTPGIDCAHGANGGATAPGVTSSAINVASTTVTSGVGSGFLGQAQNGMAAAFKLVNNAGGICGRLINLQTLNSGWDEQTGAADISNYIHSGSVFALVGQPDSEGLAGAISSQLITSSQMPVVGTDGLLSDQYGNPWVWPVAAPTITNMHIIAKYAVDTYHLTNANQFGIVYDTYYKFGAEGAAALDSEVHSLTGSDIPGYAASLNSAGCTESNLQYCGFNGNNPPQITAVNAFDKACGACKVVIMLLEPSPMESWMSAESGNTSWYTHLFGGEPLFDNSVGSNCGGCASMIVWTGYQPAVPPFSSAPAVAGYVNALKAVCPSCDAQNEFTEGAFIGAQLFINAVQNVASANQSLTRANLATALNAITFNNGLTSAAMTFKSPLHLSNTAMAAFSDNYAGGFNGWSYLNTGYLQDPAPGQGL